jgi:hypothetical protein
MEWQAGAVALQIGYQERSKPPRERRRCARPDFDRSTQVKFIRIRIVGGNKEEPGWVFIVKCFR